MTKSILTTLAFMFVITISKAQTTAMQFTGVDCNSNQVDLFADLDAGKAVILEFYMASCGSCPPPAQKIQTMANNVMKAYPGKIKGYAFPFNNSTTCTYSNSWVSSNNLSMFWTPMDSGASQVAYYGGFGMPTIVLLGGTDHKILFSSLSFSTSDTLAMRNKILQLFNGTLGTNDVHSKEVFSVFPNPATDNFSVILDAKEASELMVEIIDVTGKQVVQLMKEKINGPVTRQFSSSNLANGNYFVRVLINGEASTKKLLIAH